MEEQTTKREDLPDIQNQKDKRAISLDQVGISNRLIKAGIKMKNGQFQPVEMTVRPTVDLPEENKGIHMSRLLESFYNDGNGSNLGMNDIKTFDHEKLVSQAWDLLDRQDASSVRLVSEFNYQIVKEAPASRKEAPVNYPTKFIVECDKNGETKKFIEVEVTGTSLCPCSKEISQYGAHNQRSKVTLLVETNLEFDGVVWIEDLVKAVENSVSEEIYALLKREDEKAVTEGAYENPKFVEDIARDVIGEMRSDFSEKVNYVEVSVENEESIHMHDAYAKTHYDMKEYRNQGGGDE